MYWLSILWCTSLNTRLLGYRGQPPPLLIRYNEGLLYRFNLLKFCVKIVANFHMDLLGLHVLCK
jgi:hypothetical protein